jgi:hypothetical protein
MAEPREPIRVPVVFIGAEDTPVQYANQFVVSHQQDEFILTVGQVTPPLLLGTEAEQREQAQQLAYVPVKTVARLAFTRARLVELMSVLQENLKRFDEKKR